MNNYTLEIDKKDINKLKKSLTKSGLNEVGVKSIYEDFRYSGNNLTAILYKSGKFLIQGKTSEKLYKQIGGTVKSDSPDNFVPHIGSDEVGKGDYFGPMVVASCYVCEKDLARLKSLGVTDSKKMTDIKMSKLFIELSKIIEHEYVVISPGEYDQQIKSTRNVAVLLARAHSKVLKSLADKISNSKKEIGKIVIDQFSQSKARLLNELDPSLKKYEIEQKHHGESDIAVACASVFARAIFLDEWQKMEESYKFSFPKGASDIIGQAQVFVDQFGFDELKKVAKVSFKTTKSLRV